MDSCETCSLVSTINTSGNVLCSKFVGVWNMLWIFKVARWTRNRCTKINKSPTVSNGVRALSFENWTANLAQLLTVGTLTNSRSSIFGDSNWKFCKVGYPVGTQKPNTQMWTSLIWAFKKNNYAFIFEWKKIKTCWISKNSVFTNWEKYEVSWNFGLVFITDL